MTQILHRTEKSAGLMQRLSAVLILGLVVCFLALGVQAAFELANALKGEDYYTLSMASVAQRAISSKLCAR